MPGLMAIARRIRRRAAAQGRPHRRQPAHDHPDGGAHRDARRRSAPRSAGRAATSSPPRTTPPPPSPSRARPSSPRRAKRSKNTGTTPTASSQWHDGGTPNLILDDGGDATLLVHLGCEAEKDPSVLDRATDEKKKPSCSPRSSRRCTTSPTSTATSPRHIIGVTEETTTGVHRLYQIAKEGRLLFPAINVNDCVTKSKFDNLYGCRESLIDGIKRATDVMITGKKAVVVRLRRRRQGLRPASLRGRLPRHRHRDRPDLRPAGGMEGFQVVTMDDACKCGDIFVHRDRQRRRHHHRAHGPDEAQRHRLQHRPLRQRDSDRRPEEPEVEQDQAAGRRDRLPDGKRIIVLAKGRLVNLGCATGHPSFVMSTRSATRRWRRSSCGPITASTRKRSTCCPRSSTRRSRGCTSTSSAPS